MVQNEVFLTFLLVLLREYRSRPKIGYARLVKARNINVVVRIPGLD